MSDHKNIEDLFREAATKSGGTPVPPPDWGSMSSMLKESALIKAGGATKFGVFKALATKVVVKTTAAITITGGVATTTYLVIENRSETPVATEQTMSVNETRAGSSAEAMETPAEESAGTRPAGYAVEETASDVTSPAPGKQHDTQSAIGAPGTSRHSAHDAPAGVYDRQAPDVANLLPQDKAPGTRKETGLPETVEQGNPGQETVAQQTGNGETRELETGEPGTTSPAGYALHETPSAQPQEMPGTVEQTGKENTEEETIDNRVRFSDQGSAASNNEDSFTFNKSAADPSFAALEPAPEAAAMAAAGHSGMSTMPLFSPTIPQAPGTLQRRKLESANVNEFAPLYDARWVLSPYFAFDRSDYQVDDIELYDLAGSAYEIEFNASRLEYTAGLRAAYNLYPYLWLESGLLFSNKSQVTGTVELLDTNSRVRGIANYNLAGRFIEVPISLMVRDNNHSFGWYVKAGVHLVYNFPSQNSFYEYYDLEAEKLYTIKPNIQTLNPAISFGAGIEYNLTSSLRMYAEPTFRYALRPMLNADFEKIPVNPSWSTLGLGVGLNYYFRKKNEQQ